MASADVSAGAGTGDFGRILWHLRNDAMPIDSPHRARFGPFELDVPAGELHIDGQRVRLQNQPLKLLVLLLERAGEVVTQDAIRARLWANDTVVEFELGIGTAVRKLRRALGDDAAAPRYVETIPRRGYRWLTPVTWEAGRTGGPPAASQTYAEAPHAPTTVAPATPSAGHLAGRASCLDALHDALRRTLNGERQLVFVTGEAGIGKTALVDEFQRQAAPAVRGRLARGQCVEGHGSKEPYYPVLEALGQVCRGSGGDAIVQVLAAQAPTWLVQFPAFVTREHRELLRHEILGATRERMLREIAEALETLTATEPLLLVIEDLQWVDPSTVDVLSALARRRGPAQLLMIATERPVDAVPGHPLTMLKQDLLVHGLCEEIALKPLSEAEVGEYLAAESPGVAVPDGLGAVVYRHSEGNPLFMTAALDHLTERGLLARENGGWRLTRPLEDIRLGVPESLRQLIEAQVNSVPDEAQPALEVASVAGATFSADVIAAAADLFIEAAEDTCDNLARHGRLIRATGFQQFPNGTVSSRYEFVHALYRDVLYERLGAARRARLHLRIGERLEALLSGNVSAVASKLAYHFEQGSDWERATHYLRLAAETSMRFLAQGEAIAFLRRALGLVHHLPDRDRATTEIALLDDLATTYIVIYDLNEVDAMLESYGRLADGAAHYGLVDVEARVLVEQAYPLSWVSSERSLAALERARQVVEHHTDPSVRTKVRARCASARIWVAGWDPQAAEEVRDAQAELGTVEDRAVRAQLLSDYSAVQWASSRYREALGSAAESLALADELADTGHLVNTFLKSRMIAVWSLTFLGQLGLALQQTHAAIALLERNGNQHHTQTARLFVALARLHALDFAGVLALCESMLPSFAHRARSCERRICLALAALAETAIGSHASALERLSRAREEMDRYDVVLSWWARMLVEQGFTECFIAMGDLERARSQGARFLDVTLANADHTLQALAWEANARIAMAEADPARAAHCIHEAVATLDGFEAPLAAWRVHATAAECSERAGDGRAATRYRELSCATILELADSLPPGEPLRSAFLSAAAVRVVLDRCPDDPREACSRR